MKAQEPELVKSMPIWRKYQFRCSPKLRLTADLRSNQIGAATVSVNSQAALCAYIANIKKTRGGKEGPYSWRETGGKEQTIAIPAASWRQLEGAEKREFRIRTGLRRYLPFWNARCARTSGSPRLSECARRPTRHTPTSPVVHGWGCRAGASAARRAPSAPCVPGTSLQNPESAPPSEKAGRRSGRPRSSLLHNLVEPMDVGKYCPYCRPSYALMIASRATSSSSLYILTLIPISLIMFFMVLAITKSPNRLLNAENTISTSHRRP